MRLRLEADIQVKANVFLRAYERGKLVTSREGHNIFLDTGREWLSRLIAYQAFGATPVPQSDYRIRYMGLGIGGTRQLAPAHADAPPLDVYPPVGARSQTDLDPGVTQIERPVAVTENVWLGQVQAPATHPTPKSVQFVRTFGSGEMNYVHSTAGPLTSIPVSEVGLFHSGAVPSSPSNAPMAYDTFDIISITAAFDLEVIWELRFG